MEIFHIAQNVKWEGVIQFQQSFRSESYDCFRDISAKFVRSDCTTALNVVPWETDVKVSSFDGVLDGAFGGVGDEEVVEGEGVVVTSSSLEMLTNSFLGRIMIMAALAIAIFSDSSDEKTTTIAPVISSTALVVEMTLVTLPTGLCGLVPYSGSDFDSPDEMSSLEHISPLPAISPFLWQRFSELLLFFSD
ncbi:hypothetical protein Tco_0615038 [Tanacetum coccineum]